MTSRTPIHGLEVDSSLKRFVDEQVLRGSEADARGQRVLDEVATRYLPFAGKPYLRIHFLHLFSLPLDGAGWIRCCCHIKIKLWIATLRHHFLCGTTGW